MTFLPSRVDAGLSKIYK